MFLASPFWLIKMKAPLSTGRRDTHEDVGRGEGSGRGSISAARLRTGKELRHLAADGRGLRHLVEIFFFNICCCKVHIASFSIAFPKNFSKISIFLFYSVKVDSL